MTKRGLIKPHDLSAKEIIPWLKDNPVHDVLEQRKHEAMEIIQDITQKELGIIEELPDEVREIIKIPDSRELVGDL